MNYFPAIVVVAYNRPDSLQRLLGALKQASYPDVNVNLVISIDNSGSDEVFQVAQSFVWDRGAKEVIHRKEKLGLRRHVLSCGDLSERFGSIIMLEDDLYLSPSYYHYACECLSHYSADARVAGISLYNHRINVNCDLPFEPIADGFDNYFLQFASSWGQAWTHEQWDKFRKWYDASVRTVTLQDKVPENVTRWPESSWLKYFIRYMVDNDLYFVYPRNAYSTNCCDVGTHNARASGRFQVPLFVGNYLGQRYSSLVSSNAVYDVFFELRPEVVRNLNSSLFRYEFTVDLYGTKPVDQIETELILTSRACRNFLTSFGHLLKPRVANMVFGVPGNSFFLAKVDDLIASTSRCQWEQDYERVGPERQSFVKRVARRLLTLSRQVLR